MAVGETLVGGSCGSAAFQRYVNAFPIVGNGQQVRTASDLETKALVPLPMVT